MHPTLCSRCHKNIAVVFISKLEGDRTTNEGLCMSCARKAGLPQVDEMLRHMGMTTEEFDNYSNEMLQTLNPDDADEDDETASPGDDDADEAPEGKTTTFPFLNRLFSNGDRGGESAPVHRKKNRPAKMANPRNVENGNIWKTIAFP